MFLLKTLLAFHVGFKHCPALAKNPSHNGKDGRQGMEFLPHKNSPITFLEKSNRYYLILIFLTISIFIFTLLTSGNITCESNLNLKNITSLVWYKGRLWAASYGKGLFIWDNGKWQQYKYHVSKYITCLAVDNKDKKLWYGTWMEGEIGYIIDENIRPIKILLPQLITPRWIYRNLCILVNDKFIWIGTQGYLLRYSKDICDWDLIIHIGEVNALVSTKNKTIFIGSDEGLFKLDFNHNLTITKILSDIKITYLAEDNNNLWIAGIKNNKFLLGQYLCQTNNINYFDIALNNSITAIISSKTKVYFAEGSDSFSFNENKTLRHLGRIIIYDKQNQKWMYIRQNIKIKDIKCILIKNGNLWIGGKEGIQCIKLFTSI